MTCPRASASTAKRRGSRCPFETATLWRVIFESLALKYTWVVDQLSAVTGQHIDQIHIVGGGSQNELLCQLTANASKREVVAGPVEATAIGNIAIQAITAGELSDLGQARAAHRALVPDADVRAQGLLLARGAGALRGAAAGRRTASTDIHRSQGTSTGGSEGKRSTGMNKFGVHGLGVVGQLGCQGSASTPSPAPRGRLRHHRAAGLRTGGDGHRRHRQGARGPRHGGHLLAGSRLRQRHQQRGPRQRRPRRADAQRRPRRWLRDIGGKLPRRRHLQRPWPLLGDMPTAKCRANSQAVITPPRREGQGLRHHRRPRVRQPLRVEPAQHVAPRRSSTSARPAPTTWSFTSTRTT